MIRERYLLVMMIPCYRDGQGRRLVDELWHKDLIKHLDHIAELTLAAPLRAEPPPAGVFLPIEPGPTQGAIRFVDLPACRSTLATLATLPAACARLWKAVGHSDVVHANTGGWPISYSWFALPMARLRRKFVLTVVDSAGWRMGLRRPFRPRRVLNGVVFEVMARVMVNLSDVVTFTQAAYMKEMLLPGRRDRGHVLCASWVDDRDILPDDRAEADWRGKLAEAGRPLRVGFVGNLIAEKGLLVLFDALERLERRGVAVAVDVYGKGDLLETCEAAAARPGRFVTVATRGTLVYGPPFFEMLRGLDVVVVPSLSDEQPRVVYDAFSQAVPVIASATTGLSQCVTDGRDGRLVPPGDAGALADAIARAAADRPALRALGLGGLETVRETTHGAMHSRRATILETALGCAAAPPERPTTRSRPTDPAPLTSTTPPSAS